MTTPSSLAIILQGAPFPGATFTVTPGGAALDLVVDGKMITFCEGAWFATERRTTPAHLSFAATPTAEQVHAEIRRVLAIVMGARTPDADADLAKMTDAHAVVSQRLVGAQKEVAERDATIDELRTALESIAANVGLVGSDQWAVGELVGKVGEATARADKVEDRLRRDDDLRSAIAVAVGLDGSASLALILDTVTRDRPGREISRLSGLLDVLAAPVTFGERHLSTAERAEWALRRWLAEGKECSARMAQLIEAEVYLDVRGVPAYAAVPSDDPGDASEALTVAERLRLHFGARS